MPWQAVILLQPSVIMGKSPTGKHYRRISFWPPEFVMMERSDQLKSLCVAYIAPRNTQPIMQDCSCLVRSRMVWRCCQKLEMHWNFMQYVPTTRQLFDYKQTKTYSYSSLVAITIWKNDAKSLTAVWTRRHPRQQVKTWWTEFSGLGWKKAWKIDMKFLQKKEFDRQQCRVWKWCERLSREPVKRFPKWDRKGKLRRPCDNVC